MTMAPTSARDCAMCGDLSDARVTVPRELIKQMDNAEAYDPHEFPAKVHIHLCTDCRDISYKMAKDYETSPLPEWDAGTLSPGVVGALTSPSPSLVTRIAENALMTVKNADDDRILDSKVKEAVIVLRGIKEIRNIGGVDDVQEAPTEAIAGAEVDR